MYVKMNPPPSLCQMTPPPPPLLPSLCKNDSSPSPRSVKMTPSPPPHSLCKNDSSPSLRSVKMTHSANMNTQEGMSLCLCKNQQKTHGKEGLNKQIFVMPSLTVLSASVSYIGYSICIFACKGCKYILNLFQLGLLNFCCCTID